MKLFYRVMAESHHYRYSNPLVDNLSVTLSKMEEGLERKENTPRMPDISGVVVPNRKKRLSDSYFKLEEDTWIPKIIDDPTLPIQVLRGGERLRWGLREKCLARILFESGGRISEVTGLTLRDWVVRGTLQEVAAFSKGSHRRRVKFLRFSAATAKLLRRYFDTDRRRFDPHGWDLDQYLVRFGKRASELSTVPLFLSSRRTQIMPKAFRERYWNPACQAAGIEVDIHQARHWCVTMAVRHI
jgi:site-specific recombinase XerD